MPPTGQITQLVESQPNCPTRSTWTCACGVQADSIDITGISDLYPKTMPGRLLEECRCPKCITCGWALDRDNRCDNLDCPLVGTLILLPD